jgi:hypothetical protein
VRYGEIPSAYVALKYTENGMAFPNLLEYEVHYKAIARYIKNNLII